MELSFCFLKKKLLPPYYCSTNSTQTYRPITTKGDLEHQTLLTWHIGLIQANFFCV